MIAKGVQDSIPVESTNHDSLFGRLEGIIKQIDKRLARIETVVIGQLVMTVAILIKLFIS